MTEERKRDIEAEADRIIETHNLQTPGFNLAKFLTGFEGFMLGMQDLDDDTTGMLLVNDSEYIKGTETNRLIVVNRRIREDAPDSETFIRKRRFIVAHEYGHFILHKKADEKLFAHRDHSKRNSPQEEEADFFARCLLMPRALVEKFVSIEEVKETNLNEQVDLIARIFKVTPKKAKQRLCEDLGVGVL